ncbi:U3 snoRNP-associated protein-like EMB2271 [Ricinus communis]|uniref:U3 snoRNP-associated protein-like EMB2271 n=1 Tax=Ricinus communis TaxID=3988 RepID=UPI000772B340|nr:U3 snoRNP-associated protein-like EMB2271 [Ricinus communis]|eukprot:XP_015574906.1 U3 snoRNP-associated protein-like EMB2271 [Ricinus communis]
MKYSNKSKNSKRKGSVKQDPFFNTESKKRRKNEYRDDYIESGGEESDEENNNNNNNNGFSNSGDEKEREDEKETAQEKRQRLAKAYLEKRREILRREEEEAEEEGEDNGRCEKEGERDSLVVNMLLKEQLEDSGRLRRAIASRVEKPETVGGFEVLVKHRHSVTAVCLSDDDSKGFSASKDGTIRQWDVDTGKGEKYQWPNDETLRLHGVKNPDGRATKHSKQVLALAVSTDGRYLATGGLDRHIHLWDTRAKQHIQAFPGHRGPVSCLTFRQGTSELFSGSFDRSIKIWSVEDRAYVNTLFGHQSEVLTVDCLRKERVLATGRDRTMQLFKVPEESRLIFRSSASSLECCCFIDNDEFLSGSDDGNIELWTAQKKKPVYIVKNAHALLIDPKNPEQKDNASLSSGPIACSWVSSVAVCTGSDLAASGAGNGSVRLWAIDGAPKGIRPLYDLPLVGFINSLAFSKSGRFLAAGVGQEPRLGRWGRISAAQNGVAIQQLKFL